MVSRKERKNVIVVLKLIAKVIPAVMVQRANFDRLVNAMIQMTLVVLIVGLKLMELSAEVL
jgi:hypothetical protein